MKTRTKIAGLVAGAAILAAGCTGVNQPTGVAKDQQTSADALQTLQNAQPVPKFPYSQMRQTLIDAETAAANGTQTTTFFFARGSGGTGAPVSWCPSIGFPVPASYSLTNPDQAINSKNDSNPGVVVQQIEPTGVYTNGSSGTYVTCVTDSGKPYLTYAETDAQAVGGHAVWKDGRIQIDGDPTVTANVAKK